MKALGISETRRISRVKAGLVAALVAYSMVLALSATGAAFHEYSIGYENTGSGFTGIQVTRTDRAVTGQPSTGCSSPYTGSPVYQTQWVGGGSNWRELGTGHQCNDTYRYWFWGYGYNGTWVSLGYQTGIVNNQIHTFQISRAPVGADTRYLYRIDGVTKGSLTSSATFGEVLTGLESYAANANVVLYSHATLKYQKNDGSFLSWSGQDSSIVGTSMCGNWIGNTTWQAGQGTGC